MSKVAVMITGRARTWEECVDSIRKYVIDPHRATVFVSIHGQDASEFKEFAERLGVPLDPRQFRVSCMEPLSPDHPIWKKEPPFRWVKNKALHSFRIGSMFYHMAVASKMVLEFPEKFDVIIKLRPDMAPKEPYPLRPLPLQIDILYIPFTSNYSWVNLSRDIPDHHVYMSPEALVKYGEIFRNLEAHFDRCNLDGPERAHQHHASALGLRAVWEGTFAYDLARNRHVHEG